MNPDVNASLYDSAAQVRWILHLACAATFMVVMTLLANRLRRPIMQTLSVVWGLQTLVAVNLFCYFYWRDLFADYASVRFLGMLALHVSHFVMAPLLRHTRQLVSQGETAAAPSSRTLTRWAALGLLTTVLDQTAKHYFPAAETALTFVVSRLVSAFPYAYALWPTGANALGTLTPSRESGFTWRALHVALFARVAALAIDLVVRVAPWSIETAAMLTAVVVAVNLIALVLFGTLLLFVALEHERAVSVRQSAELYAAKLRESHSRRLESLGGLAGGVAHDFNNILTVVVSAADAAREVASSPALLQAELDAISEAGRQGTALTRQLLDFARHKPMSVEQFDSTVVLQRMRPICERVLTAARRLELQVAAVPALTMDVSQFEQVVLNLVVNARDAIESTGSVTIALSAETVTRASATATNLAAGSYVRLAVRDSGCGIPADVLPRIFDPFVTTKEARGGTGLGLATVQRVARENGGDVFVESTLGVGTTIEVWLSATPPSGA
ncbi:ATP-binding protein [Gemmatimonas sp.]|uniref:sensor histidine kinase n=1 Tax=Gemmatimonas sp. TaxID=1962908 RepID=UPI00286DCF09|nr:ATP-binding protein [Gemmatimonas sp.]